jgi:hypothetical protein
MVTIDTTSFTVWDVIFAPDLIYSSPLSLLPVNSLYEEISFPL